MRTLKYPLPRLTSVADLSALALAGSEYRDWYKWAHADIVRSAPLLEITPETLADLLALFSPRVSVSRSIKWAVHYARTHEFMHDCTRSIRAAVRYWETTHKIRGVKTGPFAKALMGDNSALVLDVWMAAALGMGDGGKRLEVVAVHSAASARIREVATLLGWPIAETQAAIWAATVAKSGRTVATLSVYDVVKGSA